MRGVVKVVLPGGLALAIALTGCLGIPGNQRAKTGSASVLISDGIVLSPARHSLRSDSTSIQGMAIGPAMLVANNSAGIVANNSAGIVANNSAGYRLLALASGLGESQIKDALVYLTDPQERFYKNAQGQIITSQTDSKGWYQLSDAVPTAEPVIVNVVLAEDRREVGFTIPQAGTNRVDISLATTIVTEFLRERAARDKKSMAAYNLAALPELERITNQLLEDERAGSIWLPEVLATPSLRIGDIPAMNRAYSIAIGKNFHGIGDAWSQLLGYRLIAGLTVAGSGSKGSYGDGGTAVAAALDTPKSLARDAAGNLYVSEEGGHRIRKIDTAGKISTLAGISAAGYNGNGIPAKQAQLNWPRTIAIGPDGNLYIGDVFNQRIRAICLNPGISYGVSMANVGHIYDIVGDPICVSGQGQCQNGYDGSGNPALGTPTASGSQTTGVRGFAWDSKGNLIFTDSWGWSGKNGDGDDPKNDIRHHVRVLCKIPGTYYGIAMPDANHVYTIAGKDHTYGFDGDEPRPAFGSAFDYLQSVVVDKDDNIYVADSSNNRIRKITKDGMVSTYAGSGPFGDGHKALSGGDGGPATKATLVKPYGLALDNTGRLFFSQKGDGLIRVIDTDGMIHPIAGSGKSGQTSDGDARTLFLNQPHDLLLLPDGNLLETDARSNKVFMFLTQWGI
ncbi:MAG: hypothetical protein HY692_07245 [Cyanobacteria bacterium NC_groundwater_1444_Ag_S-0.65um_54_12]|nr:hypothetical protein [Cyanobacteria bacterium NC_groundwater_1444_Ag_S-0.65um_54_12]